MAGLACPGDASNRHRWLNRSDRRSCAAVVCAVGNGRGDRMGCGRARLSHNCLANHHSGRQRDVVQLARREDENRGSATVLLLGASVASLLGVGFALILAGRHNGALQVLLVAFAVLTVLLSWTVVNTVFTLRYADQSIGSGDAGIAFGDADAPEAPTYRDFAYVAFTIGMCYQVSNTTVRNRRIRRTVLPHALLSYVFGVAIVGGSSTSSPV